LGVGSLGCCLLRHTCEILNFRPAEQQRLAVFDGCAVFAIEMAHESGADRVRDRLRSLYLRSDFPLHDLAGTNTHWSTKVLQRPFVIDQPPVSLQALRRDANAARAPIGHALCQPSVVAVEKRRRVRSQAMDLNESAHGVALGFQMPKRWFKVPWPFR